MRGDIGYNLVKLAQKKETFNFNVIGTYGRGSIKEMFFGSVSIYVIHTPKIPTLVIKKFTIVCFFENIFDDIPQQGKIPEMELFQ